MKKKFKRSKLKLGFVIIGLVVIIVVFFINMILIMKSIGEPNKVPNLFGYKPYIVMSDSIQTDVEFGDFVVAKKVNKLQPKDVVVVNTENKKASTYSINQIKNEMLILENDSGDMINLSKNSIEGKVVIKIKFLGEFLLLLQNPIVIVFISFVIVIIGINIYRKNY